MVGPQDWLDRIAQWIVAAVAIFCLIHGSVMLAMPRDWYFAVPTVITTGPPNLHFIRDIGVAYLTSGVMLGFAAWNLRLRWLAALAGNLWLLFHGILHIYEVSVGICSPGIFWADAPGVLGPPGLVLLAVGLIAGRQHIAPAGVPRAVFMKAATDKVDETDAQYLREIAAAPGHTLEKFKHFMPASMHRHRSPALLFHAARIGATLAEDCGPCALTCARWAQADNVPDAVINEWLSGASGSSDDEKLAFRFGEAIATQSTEAFELGDRIEQQFGRDVRLELAMTAALVRAYPAMKRGLGLTKTCSTIKLEL